MNIKKVEKSSRKINQLLENIKEEGNVSSIEKDLLLSYIRDMYEKVLDLEEGGSYKTQKSSTREKAFDIPKPEKKETPAPTPTPVPAYIADVVRREVVDSAPEPVRQAIVQEVEQIEKVVIEEYKAPVYETPAYAAPEPVVEEVVSVPSAPAELLNLFSTNAISELSDRLSMSPISDLTKSMGINEKIFTIQELFGGDSSLFSKTMQELDKLSSLEQARDYLVTNVALDQDWASEPKIKKAANLVKLISRRY